MVAAVAEIDADGRIGRARVAVGACSRGGAAARRARRPRSPAGRLWRRRPDLVRPDHLAALRPIDDVRGTAAVPARRRVGACSPGAPAGARMTSRHAIVVNGRPRIVRRRPDAPALGRPPGRPRAYGHEGRVRGRRLRRVHRPARRPPGRVLPRAGGPGRGRGGVDGRGPGGRRMPDATSRRRSSPTARRSAASARPGMLDGGGRAAPREPDADDQAIRDGIGGRAVPVHRAT